jgi:hypothetical protein
MVAEARACRKSTRQLLRNTLVSPENKSQLENVLDIFQHYSEPDPSREKLKNWLNRAGFEHLDSHPDSLERAMKAYFQGSPPYKMPKDRTSIPDAIIYESVIQALNAENSLDPSVTVFFVSADNALRTAIPTKSEIRVFGSIGELLKSKEIVALKNLIANENWEETLQSLYEKYVKKWRQELLDFCTHLVESEGAEWVSDEISPCRIPPLYEGWRAASITAVGEPNDIVFLNPGSDTPTPLSIYDACFAIDVSVTFDVPKFHGLEDQDGIVYIYDGIPHRRTVEKRTIYARALIDIFFPNPAELPSRMVDPFIPPTTDLHDIDFYWSPWWKEKDSSKE